MVFYGFQAFMITLLVFGGPILFAFSMLCFFIVWLFEAQKPKEFMYRFAYIVLLVLAIIIIITLLTALFSVM